MEIDLSKLDTTAAERLRSLFEQAAAGARTRGWEAEETFLISLSAILTGYLAPSAGPAQEPAENRRSLHLDLTGASDEVLRCGRDLLLRAAVQYRKDGHEGLDLLMLALARVLAAHLPPDPPVPPMTPLN